MKRRRKEKEEGRIEGELDKIISKLFQFHLGGPLTAGDNYY
jgi:hypothetical protein